MKFFNYTQTDKNSLDCFRLRLRNDAECAACQASPSDDAVCSASSKAKPEAIQKFIGEIYIKGFTYTQAHKNWRDYQPRQPVKPFVFLYFSYKFPVSKTLYSWIHTLEYV
jgi:hypothetical protein